MIFSSLKLQAHTCSNMAVIEVRIYRLYLPSPFCCFQPACPLLNFRFRLLLSSPQSKARLVLLQIEIAPPAEPNFANWYCTVLPTTNLILASQLNGESSFLAYVEPARTRLKFCIFHVQYFSRAQAGSKHGKKLLSPAQCAH